jgi:phosphatidylglycerophosphate synthase
MATEGELWTRQQLQRVRERRFGPVAVARFLVASQRRAASVHAERPEVVRREARWALVGAAGWLGFAALDVRPFRRRVRAGLSGWAVTMAMLDWHLGMLETPDGRPRNLGPADLATLTRAWLIPAVSDHASGWLCGIGFATDALDGRLARASEPTRLGRDLEGLVDGAFTLAVVRGARRSGSLGALPAACEAARVGLGFAYAVGVYFGRARPPDPRLLRSGRALAPVRAAGLILAGCGRRRLADALLVGGSTASLATAFAATRGGVSRLVSDDDAVAERAGGDRPLRRRRDGLAAFDRSGERGGDA